MFKSKREIISMLSKIRKISNKNNVKCFKITSMNELKLSKIVYSKRRKIYRKTILFITHFDNQKRYILNLTN